MSDAIEIVSYDPRWAHQFAELADRVYRVAPAHTVLAVEHVGSTSVPGLAAKPVIDMDVVISSPAGLDPICDALAGVGYIHEGDLGIAGRDAFRWPPGEPRHHLYVCAKESQELRRHLAFHDYLRAHPDAAQEYGALKSALAAKYRNDRRAYSEGKTCFISAVLRAAGLT